MVVLELALFVDVYLPIFALDLLAIYASDKYKYVYL
jgi:hypothetical protein